MATGEGSPWFAASATDVPPHPRQVLYPEVFADRMVGRVKYALRDAFGRRIFGVNLPLLAPGAISALRHAHSPQDGFINVLDCDFHECLSRFH